MTTIKINITMRLRGLASLIKRRTIFNQRIVYRFSEEE